MEKKYEIDAEGMKDVRAYFDLEDARTLTAIVNHFDTYKFVEINKTTYSHDGMEDMGEEWDSDKETRDVIDFAVDGKDGCLTVRCSECGYFNGVHLQFDGNQVDLPYAGHNFAGEIVEDPSVLKQYLQEILDDVDKNVGTRELVRRDDFINVYYSPLVTNKEKQERSACENILRSLRDNGFHVALTDIDPGIKGAHIALLYEDDIAPMVTFDIANLPAIKFGRELYKFLALNIKTEKSKKVQQMLIAMFSGKQKTTAQPKAETVENKTAPAAEVAAESANVKEEDNIYNPYDEMVEPAMPVPDKSAELKVFAFYNGKRGYVNRVTKFWLNDEDFYVGIVYKNDVKVGSWTWNAKFKYPKYKPVTGQLGGDGETAFMYVYPKQLAAMTEKDRLNHVNINGYILAITVALAKQGIVTKYKPQKEYGARVADQSSVRTVTGRTYKKPEPVVVGSGPDDNDLAFYE